MSCGTAVQRFPQEKFNVNYGAMGWLDDLHGTSWVARVAEGRDHNGVLRGAGVMGADKWTSLKSPERGYETPPFTWALVAAYR